MFIRTALVSSLFSFAHANIRCVVDDFSNTDKLSNLFVEAFMKVESCGKQELVNRFNALLSLKYCEWISFYEEEELVGFAVLDLKKYPDYIHLRQGCVRMDKQHMGISKRCFTQVLERHKKCNTFHIMAQKTNILFQKILLSLGFFPSEFLEDGYDPAIYMGFTFVRKHP